MLRSTHPHIQPPPPLSHMPPCSPSRPKLHQTLVATLHHYQHFDHHLYPILLDHQLNPHTLRHCVPFFFLFCFIFFFLTLFFYFSFSFLFFLGESATELINTSGSPQSPVRKQHLGTHRWLRYSSGEIPQLFLFFCSCPQTFSPRRVPLSACASMLRYALAQTASFES